MWLRVLRSLSVRLARMERAGDQGPELAAAFDDPPVALAEEGIGLRRGGRDLAQGALDLLPLPVLPERFFGPVTPAASAPRAAGMAAISSSIRVVRASIWAVSASY